MMKPKAAAILTLLVLSAALGACSRPPRPHERLHSTLWIQTAAEYRIAAEQSYRLATIRLKEALTDPTWTAALEQEGTYAHLPPAVIVDIDETVLDNSPFQAQLIKHHRDFDFPAWDRWVSQAQARAVPGALEFVRFAQDKGVEVFFVTNRGRAIEAETRANLEKLGFPVKSNPDNVLTRDERPGWSADKSSRRWFIAQDFRILLLIGDNVNDFVSTGHVPPKQRVVRAAKHRAHWGTKWILLPNPLYGSWERALYDYDHTLPVPVKLKRKVEALQGFE